MSRAKSHRGYFNWLCRQVKTPDPNSRWELFGELHQKQFTWSVPNDDNRVADAAELRAEYWGTYDGHDTEVVSVLEVLIALSRRVSWEEDSPAKEWAWKLLENLTLHRDRFLDPLYTPEINEIGDILDALIWRQYKPSGLGGFFPLAFPSQDQTKVEVWYQMSAYLEERHPEHDH